MAWRFSPCFVFRSPGFEFAGVSAMTFRRAPQAIDRILKIEAALGALAPRLREHLGAFGRVPPSSAMPATLPAAVDKRIGRRKPIPEGTIGLFEGEKASAWRELVGRWNVAAAARAPATAAAREAMAEELSERRRTLGELFHDQRMREAVWASARNFSRNFERYLDRPIGKRGTKERQIERTAMLFLQRLTAKNDTISFFGPFVWGRFRPDSQTNLVHEAGAGDLIRRRLVSCEYWAVTTLARRISADPAIRMELCPYLKPSCFLDGSTLFYPIGHRAELDPRRLAVIRLADGRRTSRQLLEALESSTAFAGCSPDKIRAVYQDLIDRKILVCELTVPTALPNTERHLLRQLERLPEGCASKARWVAEVRRFCDWIEEYARSGYEDRRRIVDEMDGCFRELTGEEPTRGAGEMYAGRTLIYEDCETNVGRCEVGGALLADIESLSPLFEIARWISLEIARRYHGRFLELFRRLSGGRSRPVDFLLFLQEAAVFNEEVEIETDLYRELQEVWREVLGPRLTDARDEVTLAPADGERVLAKLRHTRTGDRRMEVFGHNFHSPDFLFVAKDLDAVNRGDYAVVMGEIHKSTYMVTMPWAMPFCPYRDEVESFLSQTMTEPVLEFSDPPLRHIRANINWPVVPPFHEIVTEARTSRYPPERIINVGELEVVEEDGNLFVGSRDQRHRVWFPSVIRYFNYRKFQKNVIVDPLPVLGEKYSPCLRYGPRVVLQRRRWKFDREELPEVSRLAADSMELWLAVRSWQQQAGIPRLVFIKVPTEPKPVLIDFDNFLSVELFLRLTRKSPVVSISEMVPGPEDLWMRDADGRRFVSEIRTTVVRMEDAGPGESGSGAGESSNP